MGTKVTLKRPDGQDASAYFAPTGRAFASNVIVIQEWWGLQDQIKGLCDRLSLAGYNALAPDLYHGVAVPYHDHAAAEKEMMSLNFIEATDQTVRACAQFLSANGKKVGLTGFCMGGAVTLLGATRVKEISAAVCFYGLPPESGWNPADLTIPLECHFANSDDWCSPRTVDLFEQKLKSLGKTVPIYRYDASHAFMNEQRTEVHNRACAEQAWGRLLDFWGRTLST